MRRRPLKVESRDRAAPQLKKTPRVVRLPLLQGAPFTLQKGWARSETAVDTSVAKAFLKRRVVEPARGRRPPAGGGLSATLTEAHLLLRLRLQDRSCASLLGGSGALVRA